MMDCSVEGQRTALEHGERKLPAFLSSVDVSRGHVP